jgi:hypothetical protein
MLNPYHQNGYFTNMQNPTTANYTTPKFSLGSTGQPRPNTPEWVHSDATGRDYD